MKGANEDGGVNARQKQVQESALSDIVRFCSHLRLAAFGPCARPLFLDTFKSKHEGLASVAGAVIEATARPDLEDFLRTRSPGEVING